MFYKLLILLIAIAPDADAQYRRTEVKNVPGTVLEVNSTQRNSSGTVVNPSTEDRQIELIGISTDTNAVADSIDVRISTTNDKLDTTIDRLDQTIQKLADIFDRQNDRTQKVRLTDGTRDNAVSFTGFDVQKTALETQIFEEGFNDGLNTDDVWSVFTVGGGTVNVTEAQGQINTSADGDTAILQTQLAHSYLHGFSNNWRIRLRTGDVGEIAGSIREWGVSDSTNGYIFRLDEAGLHIVIIRQGVETVISSSSWLSPAIGVPPFTMSPTAHSYNIQYLDGNRVLFYADGRLLYQATSQTSNLVANSQLRTRIRNVQSGGAGGLRLMEIYGLAVLRDGAPFSYDTAGNLKVSGGVAAAPAGTDPIAQPAEPRASINPNQTIDEIYTITSGKALTIQVVNTSAASAGTGKSVIVTLYDDPNGDLSVLTPLFFFMGNNFNDEGIIDKTFVGDGVRRIVLRSQQIGSASMEIARQWRGFEQ